jgi:hypothetical protein
MALLLFQVFIMYSAQQYMIKKKVETNFTLSIASLVFLIGVLLVNNKFRTGPNSNLLIRFPLLIISTLLLSFMTLPIYSQFSKEVITKTLKDTMIASLITMIIATFAPVSWVSKLGPLLLIALFLLISLSVIDFFSGSQMRQTGVVNKFAIALFVTYIFYHSNLCFKGENSNILDCGSNIFTDMLNLFLNLLQSD